MRQLYLRTSYITMSSSTNQEKVVVIYSGGMDSFTVLNKALQQGYQAYALSFNYGQRHLKELDYAQKACEQLTNLL